VKAGDDTVASQTFTFDCVEGDVVTQQPPPAQVLGVQIRPPEAQQAAAAPRPRVAGEQLPATGMNAEEGMNLLMVAVVLVLAGIGLIMTGRLSFEGNR